MCYIVKTKTTKKIKKAIIITLTCIISFCFIWLFLLNTTTIQRNQVNVDDNGDVVVVGLAKNNISENISNADKQTISNLIALNNSETHLANNLTQIAMKLLRGKRYLDFTKGARMSWRTTVKNNILSANTLWGYGFGFRANFPFANKEDRRRPFFKRDLLHTFRSMLDGHGLDGSACILKSYCTALLDAESELSGGMLFKLLRLLFSFEMDDKQHFPFLRMENCRQLLHSHCPLSFNSISLFTDDI